MKAKMDFLKLLEEMENKKEKVRTVSGEFEGPFDSKAVYGYTVKLGIEKNDFPFRRGFHPRPRPLTHARTIRSENVTKRHPLKMAFLKSRLKKRNEVK